MKNNLGAVTFLPIIYYFQQMEKPDIPGQVKQAMLAFWINLAMTCFAFATMISAYDSGSSLKQGFATTGFMLFLGLTLFLFFRLRKLKKFSKEYPKNNEDFNKTAQ